MKQEEGWRPVQREDGAKAPSRSTTPTSTLADNAARGKSPAPPRSFSPSHIPGPRVPSPRREPPPPDAKPQKPAVRRAGEKAAQSLFKTGLTFASATKGAAATFRAAWAAAAAGLRSAAAMLRTAAASSRPIVHLAATPAAALFRTLVIAVVISPQGLVRFLAPLEPECLLGRVLHQMGARRAALAVARDVLAALPIPMFSADASPLLIPAFERVPSSSDLTQVVDRIVAVPIFSSDVPPFSADHDGWLHWTTLAVASSLVYMMVAHAVNRVRTYRAVIPRALC